MREGGKKKKNLKKKNIKMIEISMHTQFSANDNAYFGKGWES